MTEKGERGQKYQKIEYVMRANPQLNGTCRQFGCLSEQEIGGRKERWGKFGEAKRLTFNGSLSLGFLSHTAAAAAVAWYEGRK